MRLRRLQLVNYRRFADASVAFPDGLIGIVGRNGAGKSSLLEAILWALFGHEAARTTKDLVKRQEAAVGEDVVVRLEFETDGLVHAVTRRLRGKGLQPEAAVESVGSLVVAPGPNSWEQANQFLIRLLGFDRSSFETTVVAKQNEVAALSQLRPAQRKRVLLGLLGIDRVDHAIQSARNDARVLDARLAEARRAFADEAVVRAELDQIRAARAMVEETLQTANSEDEALRRRNTAMAATVESLWTSKGRDQELRARLQMLQARLETIWTQRTRLNAEVLLIKERVAQASDLRRRLDQLGDVDQEILEVERAQHQLMAFQALERRRDQAGAELAALMRSRGSKLPGASESDLLARISRLSQSSDQLSAEHGRIETEIASLRRRLAEPKPTLLDPSSWNANDCCPTCGRALGVGSDEMHEHLRAASERWVLERQEAEGRLSAVSDQLKEILQSKEALAADRRAAERSLQESQRRAAAEAVVLSKIARSQETLAALTAELGSTPQPIVEPGKRERLVLARAERDRLRETISQLDEAQRRLPRMQDEDRLLAGQETETVTERETASRELRSLRYEAGSWEKANSEWDATRRRLETLGREIVQWSERVESHRRDETRLTESLARMDARRLEVQDLERGLRLLEALSARRGETGLLPEFRTHLIGRLRPALSRAAGDLLSQMTHGRYADLVLDEEYGASLYDGGVAHPLERFSGGEVDVCNLALRLAVSELVSNAQGRGRIQFVALDEVLGSQDEARRGAILGALHSLAGSFRQVLVVTHTEDVRERLEHVLRIEDVGDGSSRLVPSWSIAAVDSARPAMGATDAAEPPLARI